MDLQGSQTSHIVCLSIADRMNTVGLFLCVVARVANDNDTNISQAHIVVRCHYDKQCCCGECDEVIRRSGYKKKDNGRRLVSSKLVYVIEKEYIYMYMCARKFKIYYQRHGNGMWTNEHEVPPLAWYFTVCKLQCSQQLLL